MGMAHLKFINASRGPIHEYENPKRKLYIHKLCLTLSLYPYSYIQQNGDGSLKEYTIYLPTVNKMTYKII